MSARTSYATSTYAPRDCDEIGPASGDAAASSRLNAPASPMNSTATSARALNAPRRVRASTSKRPTGILPMDSGSGGVRDVPPYAETPNTVPRIGRSEEHTSELQSRPHLVCRLLLEKK